MTTKNVTRNVSEIQTALTAAEHLEIQIRADGDYISYRRLAPNRSRKLASLRAAARRTVKRDGFVPVLRLGGTDCPVILDIVHSPTMIA